MLQIIATGTAEAKQALQKSDKQRCRIELNHLGAALQFLLKNDQRCSDADAFRKYLVAQSRYEREMEGIESPAMGKAIRQFMRSFTQTEAGVYMDYLKGKARRLLSGAELGII